MNEYAGLKQKRKPNWQGLVDNILRKGTPDRTYHIELFHDWEIIEAIIKRFDLDKGLKKNNDEDFNYRRFLAF